MSLLNDIAKIKPNFRKALRTMNNPPFFIIFLTNNICKTAKNEATLHLNFETFLLTF